tara:strand:+ start:7 stop:1617 length:1611 start_codon:yes stop_codon:yes gene_type:complete
MGLARKIIDRYEYLKGQRVNWDQHWQELADYVIPRKDDVYKTNMKGEKKGNQLFDSTGIHSNELLASALHGMLTNPATPWFSLSTGDEFLDQDDEVRLWLQDSARQMHNVLNNSNFHTHIHELYLDVGCFGTGLMRIEEHDTDVVRFQSRPIYESYISENHQSIVDTVYRTFKYSVRQIRQHFGEEAMDQSLLEQLKTNYMQEYEIIHAVEPIEDDVEYPATKKGFKFRSAYVLKEKQLLLNEGGFKEFPFVVPRWTKIAGEVYGRSPAMKALADLKMLNLVMKTTIRGAQKVIDPPLLMPDDGVLMPFKTTPGAINFYRAGLGTDKMITPLETGSKIDFGIQFVESIRMKIREAFFIDQLQLNTGPQMTATEVAQRTEEKLRLLGPILGRQQFELLRPMVGRLFNIMMRKKMLGMIPEVLADRELQVQYSSQIAKAQKTSEADSFVRVMNILAPLSQLQPEIIDNLNGDQALRFLSKAYGLPEQMLRPMEDVIGTREARQAQQAQAQQMQQMMAQASMAKDGASALQNMSPNQGE